MKRLLFPLLALALCPPALTDEFKCHLCEIEPPQESPQQKEFNRRLKEAQQKEYKWKYFDHMYYRINLRTARQFKKGVYWAELERRFLDSYLSSDGIVADCNQMKTSRNIGKSELFNGAWRRMIDVPRAVDKAEIDMLNYFCVERK